MAKQVNLYGEVEAEHAEISEREDAQIWKSVLQKAVRRGMTEKAMYAAYRLSNKETGYILWRRLSIISVEDVGSTEAILAVETLKKQAGGYGYDTWEGKRCAVCAAKLLAEAAKDRRADEFLELMAAVEKHAEHPDLRKKREDLEQVPDEALDMHTTKGRRMGRGPRYWYEVSSETVNKTDAYREWREWWKPLMLRLLDESKERK